MYNVNDVYLADGVFFQSTHAELRFHKYRRTPRYGHPCALYEHPVNADTFLDPFSVPINGV